MTTKCWKCDKVIFDDTTPSGVETNYYTCDACKKETITELTDAQKKVVEGNG